MADPTYTHLSKNINLREQRLNELLESCHQEMIQKIVGPFGLTPAMFNDKNGGDVTTQHNADQGTFAKKSEEYDRDDYNYRKAKQEKLKESFEAGTINSQEFVDGYTGKLEPTTRVNCNGKTVMNAELDHTVPLKEAHNRGGWMKDEHGRAAISSEKDNLNYTTHKTNRKKGASDPTQALSEKNGFNEAMVQPLIEKGNAAIDAHMPTTRERIVYHGTELLHTSVRDAGKQAVRQAMGVLFHEFVSQSFVEIKRLFRDRKIIINFIDELGNSLKRVGERVIKKLRNALEALVSGGIEGIVSNLLTFLINNFITTAAKVVTLIRESARSLWRAIKLLISPPPHLTGFEVAREASKILAAAVTLAMGMMIEESIKGFFLSVPLLAPVAEVVAPVVSGIVTGLSTALVIYGLDRLFDKLASKGTDLLKIQWDQADAQAQTVELLHGALQNQVETSALYEQATLEYERVMRHISASRFHLTMTEISSAEVNESGRAAIDLVKCQVERQRSLQHALDVLLLPADRPLEGVVS